jgi:glycosyltransferase involved in cell wall biosynthesis
VIRVMHVITGLDIGGAEMMLFKLLSASGSGRQSMVVSLKDEGRIGPSIAKLGVAVECLHLRPHAPNPARLLSLVRLTRKFRPQLIQGWLSHGNLAASFAQFASRTAAPVIWNVRMSLDGVDREKPLTMGLTRIGALFSRHPSAIVYNSQSGAKQHQKRGYRPAVSAVIPNGFDCDIFRPDEHARRRVREQLGLDSNTILIGLVARLHPAKDNFGFLHAASLVSAMHPESRFLMVGRGLVKGASAVIELVNRLNLTDRVFLLGERTDIPQLTAGMDIACSSSAYEGFSNSIGEAMACGVPCAVTDVGDSAYLVGDTGVTVPRRNPEALAHAIQQLIDAGPVRRKELGMRARDRIESEFTLPKITRRYDELYQGCLASRQKLQTGRHTQTRSVF